MDQIDQIFDRLRDPAALGHVITSFEQLASAQPDLDREARADRSTDRLQHLTCQADPVLQRTAVSICPMIEIGRQELVEQPAVTGMNHNHFIPGAFCQGRLFPIGADDIGDLLHGQSLHGTPVGTDAVGGAPLIKTLLFVLVRHIGAGILSRMRELDARYAPVPTDAVCHEGMCGQAARRLEVQVQHVAPVRLRMDDQFADRDSRCPSLCPEFIETLHPGTGTAVGRDVGRSHGSGKHPVSENRPAQLDRARQEGVSVIHLNYLII